MQDIFLKLNPDNLHEVRNDLQFLSENKKKSTNLQDKRKYIIQIRNQEQELNYGLVLKKIQKLIKFNQKAWLKSYIDMNTELQKKAKNDFGKDIFKPINSSVFGRTK